MKRDEFEKASKHYDDVAFEIDELMVGLAERHNISHEQAAALSISALARTFFPEHRNEEGLSITVQLDPGRKINHYVTPFKDTLGNPPIEDGVETLVLEIPGRTAPFDDPVDAIIYSDSVFEADDTSS